MTVRELVVELILKATGLKKGLADAERGLEGVTDAAQKTERQAERTGKALTAAAQDGQGAWDNLKGAILGVASVAGLVGAATNFAEQTKQLAQYSAQLGMTVEQWQAWAGAAQTMGIEAQDLYDTFRDMSDWTIDMVKNDSGPFKDFAKQTGLSLKDAKGNMVGAEEALLRLSKAVEGMKPDEATGWLTQMGVDATSISLILKGRKGIEDLVRSMKEKAVYDERDIQNSNKMQAAWFDVTLVFRRLAATAINAVAPAFDWIQKKADSLFKFIKNNEGTVGRVFKGLAAIIGSVLIPKLVRMGAAAWASLGPFALIPAAIMAIGVAIDDFIVWLEGGESKLADFWSMFGTAEEVSARLQAIWDGLKATWESVKNIVSNTLDLFKGFFTGDWDAVLNALENLKAAFSGLGKIIGSVVDWVKEKLAGLVPDWLRDFLGGNYKPGRQLDADDAEQSAIAAATRAAASGAQPTFASDRASGSNMRQALAGGGYGAGDAARGAKNITTTNNKTTTVNQTNNINITAQSSQPEAIADATKNAIPKNTVAMADGGIGV